MQETAAEKKSAKTKSKEQPAPAASSEGPGRGQQPVAASSSEGPRPTRGDVAATLVSQGAATSSAVTPAATEKPDLLAEMKKNKRFQEDDAPPDKDGGRSAKKKAKASARKEKAAAKEKASKIAAASAPPPRPSAAPEPVASLPGLFLESTPDVSETRKVPAKQRGPPFPPERRDDEDFDQRPSAASKEQSRPTSGSGSNAMAEKMKEYSATRSVRGVEQVGEVEGSKIDSWRWSISQGGRPRGRPLDPRHSWS